MKHITNCLNYILKPNTNKWSNWIDLKLMSKYEGIYLLTYRIHLQTNKKEFKEVKVSTIQCYNNTILNELFNDIKNTPNSFNDISNIITNRLQYN